MIETFASFEDAQAALQPGLVVSGAYLPVLKDDGTEDAKKIGSAIYFLVPETAGARDMRLTAYEARWGEPHPDPAYLDWLASEATR